MSNDPSHLVAIVGRPNVGKSTLFNRMIGRSKAITSSEAGGTRDRNYDLSEWNNRTFTVIDTGGYLVGKGANFEKAICEQVKLAIEECNLILFLVDCRTGLLPNDRVIADLLRQSKKPVLVVANKADNTKEFLSAPMFYEIGLGNPYPISATHGSGTGDLMDAIIEKLDIQSPSTEEEEFPRISFIGKPNVGKSTLMNTLLSQERSIVSEHAHTTRDALHSYYNLYGKKFIITDTAGIYRKCRVKEAIEFYSVIRSVKAIQYSDVCIVVISAEEGLTKQDLHILQLVHRHKKGILLLVNKWDLIDKTTFDPDQYRKALTRELGTLAYTPILFTSGLKKQRIYQMITKALDIYENRRRRVPTPQLNKIIEQAIARTPPPVVKGKLIKIKYATQMPFPSPTFALFSNLPQYVSASYKRYLSKQIRAQFDLEGAPVTLVCKQNK